MIAGRPEHPDRVFAQREVVTGALAQVAHVIRIGVELVGPAPSKSVSVVPR
jgi:hypothetical protein